MAHDDHDEGTTTADEREPVLTGAQIAAMVSDVVAATNAPEKKADPYKLTGPVAETLIGAAADLLPYDDQAAAAGIASRTYRGWRAAGRRGEEPFASLWAAICKAEAEGKRSALRTIRAAGEKNAAWACWILERRFPQQFSTVPKLRPELQEEEAATSVESRKSALIERFTATRGEAHRRRDEAGGDE